MREGTGDEMAYMSPGQQQSAHVQETYSQWVEIYTHSDGRDTILERWFWRCQEYRVKDAMGQTENIRFGNWKTTADFQKNRFS